jgi:hypothetical protein
LTKPIHDELKCHSPLDDKVDVAPQIIDNTHLIGAPNVSVKPKSKVKVGMVKAKMTKKTSRLEKATSNLYDLEDRCTPEKALNIDLGLYQMEDY